MSHSSDFEAGTSEPVDLSPPSSPLRHAEDLELASRILAGDVDAWQSFVRRYAGLIYSVVRRTLRTRDVDEIRPVMVDVLVALHDGKLRSYEGRASLSTWIVLVARSETLDDVRRRFGRSRMARTLLRLGAEQRDLFRMYFLEGRTPGDVMLELSRSGTEWSPERFRTALDELEVHLGDAWLQRMAYERHAHATGALSGRMLQYIDQLKLDLDERSGAESPEFQLMEREARRTADLLRAVIEDLEPGERRMLQLRFERRWTAREIAEDQGLPSSRGVYSTLDRILRKLRRLLGEKDVDST